MRERERERGGGGGGRQLKNESRLANIKSNKERESETDKQ